LNQQMTMGDSINEIILALNEFEPIVLYLSIAISVIFLFKWYGRILFSWPMSRGKLAKIVLSLLPAAAFLIIFPTLKTLASHDVVNDPYYLTLYTALGFAWLALGVFIMNVFFGFSWLDDILNINNKAALIAFTGGYLGLTVIYAASNVGDGPGWGCVIFTVALGLALWLAFALIQNHFSQVFERITIERDAACAVRFGSFLLANAIILSRDLAGEWLSVSMTLADFIPTFIAIGAEMLFIGFGKVRKEKLTAAHYASGGIESNVFLSIIWAIILIAGAVGTVIILK